MSFSPRAGITSTALINGTELPIIGWNRRPIAIIVRFVNSLSGGHPVYLPTITDGGKFSIEFDWDDANQPFAAPLSIRVGTIITVVKLLIDTNVGTRFVSIPSAIVESTPFKTVVEGKIAGSIDCQTSGQWAEIGGTLS